jgi:hypothetical protein
VTPRQAWNEACDELERADEALTLAQFALNARSTTGSNDEVLIKHAKDRVAAAKERYHEARVAEEAACRRVLREVREEYDREREETTWPKK